MKYAATNRHTSRIFVGAIGLFVAGHDEDSIGVGLGKVAGEADIDKGISECLGPHLVQLDLHGMSHVE